ncbi:hypothetical protein F4777DRAFT_599338 [Nemania sp. FL0916]|nr:hypothetical protein F4777DRAFT_599338 [Nemania sp. FL0916]
MTDQSDNTVVASELEAITNNNTPKNAVTAVTMDAYTRLNLAAITFVHPPNRSDIKYCPCNTPATPQTKRETTLYIRVYHTEPSVYAYNQNSWLVRETRFSTAEGWHAPGDDLVADDALPGSPVAVTGWWIDGPESGHSVWETRVYYIDTTGHIRERTNLTSFSPAGLKDGFDRSLPEPAELIPPQPGWKLTPLLDDAVGKAAAAVSTSPDIIPFPKIKPLKGSKLAAIEVHGRLLVVLYQAPDQSIRDARYEKANKKWDRPDDRNIVEAGKAKAGTPLAALVGGWWEHRVFYVTPEDKLAGMYGDEYTAYRDSGAQPYQLSPSAMISAVAWNYGTPFFEMRIYTTDDKDALYEMAYSRDANGWKPTEEPIAPIPAPASKSPTPGGGKNGSPPLSAVAAVLLDGEYRTKVYFHPRRTIGEWDVCAKTPAFNGLPKTGTAAAAEKRALEEKSRGLIKEEEERKAREAARIKAEQEARERAKREAKAKAEQEAKEKERIKAEQEAREKAEREAKAKEQKPAPAPAPKAPKLMVKAPRIVMGDLVKAPKDVDDEYARVDNLPFPLSFYGRKTTSVWITDNGIIALDADDPAIYSHELCQAYRTGDKKALPFRETRFPKYALFPLWADLKLCEGRKHGIFFEVDGNAPGRTLTVEWLVTQYHAEDDYYHFSATFEEARPGVVTYKYNAVDGDAGTKCAIGAQGGGYHLQYEYKAPGRKIQPGLMVEVDTIQGKCTQKTFATTARG